VPIDVDTPYSDGWWLKLLAKKFGEKPRRQRALEGDSRRCEFTHAQWCNMLWNRLVGDTPFLRVNEKYADATREFMRLTRTNYAALTVGSTQDRTALLGARSSVDNDADGDTTVRRFMDANGAFFADALTFTYTMGKGAVIVAPPQDGEQVATATAEDPREVVWVSDPVRPTKVRAALKLYRDDDLNEDVAHLFLSPIKGVPASEPEGRYRIRVARRTAGAAWTGLRFSGRDWEWDDDPEVSGPLPADQQEFGLPVVPLVNRFGMGEFEPVIDLLDRIHNGIADTLWTAKYQAFIQRALIGDLPETDPRTGEKVDYDSIFSADPGALWRMPKGSEVWESRQADLTGMLNIRKADLLELSATTQTPMFMFTPDATGQSAEGADVARESSVNKAKDRIRRLNPAAVRISRLGLAYSDQIDAARGEIETIWAPVREYSLSQRSSAASAAKTSGVPTRSILSDIWQFPPETVARMEKERRTELLFLPPATPATPASSGAGSTQGA
jgi:hypothetical protein